jgi:hypothetical protein
VDSNGSGYDPGEGCCETSKVPLDTIKSGDEEEVNVFRNSTNISSSRKTSCHGDN